MDQLALNLKGISTVSNTPITASLAFRLNGTAALAVQGAVKISPLFADLNASVTNLDLRAAQPYLDQFVALSLASGNLDAAGHLRFQTGAAAEPRLTFVGGVRLTNVVTLDQVLFKEFVRWDDLALDNIDASVEPNRLNIGELRLVRDPARTWPVRFA